LSFDHLQYPIKTLPNGDRLNLNAYRLTGSAPGPHVYIQASVHGAEVQGNGVVYHLLDFFSKNEFRGSLTIIPTANPMSINTKAGTFTQGRFNATSGNNWNRNYQNLEEYPEIFSPKAWLESLNLAEETKGSIRKKFKHYLGESLKKLRAQKSEYAISDDVKLNLTLQHLASSADIVLDLHTGPKACRYLYAGEFEKEKVVDLPFPFTIIIPNEFAGAMDEATFMPWVILSRNLKAMNLENLDAKSFEAYTVELGSEESLNMNEALRDAERILSFLSKRGVLANDFHPTSSFEPQRAGFLKDYKTYFAPIGGLYEFTLKPGDHALKGQGLCKFLNFAPLEGAKELGGILEQCLGEIKLLEEAHIINHSPSAVVSEGQALYQVLEKTWSLK